MIISKRKKIAQALNNNKTLHLIHKAKYILGKNNSSNQKTNNKPIVPYFILQSNLSKHSSCPNKFYIFITNAFLALKKNKYKLRLREFEIDSSQIENLKRFYDINDCKDRLPKYSLYYKEYLYCFCRPLLNGKFYQTLIIKNMELKAHVFYEEKYLHKGKESKDKIDLGENKGYIFFDANVKKEIEKNKKETNNSHINIDCNKNNEKYKIKEKKIKTNNNFFDSLNLSSIPNESKRNSVNDSIMGMLNCKKNINKSLNLNSVNNNSFASPLQNISSKKDSYFIDCCDNETNQTRKNEKNKNDQNKNIKIDNYSISQEYININNLINTNNCKRSESVKKNQKTNSIIFNNNNLNSKALIKSQSVKHIKNSSVSNNLIIPKNNSSSNLNKIKISNINILENNKKFLNSSKSLNKYTPVKANSEDKTNICILKLKTPYKVDINRYLTPCHLNKQTLFKHTIINSKMISHNSVSNFDKLSNNLNKRNINKDSISYLTIDRKIKVSEYSTKKSKEQINLVKELKFLNNENKLIVSHNKKKMLNKNATCLINNKKCDNFSIYKTNIHFHNADGARNNNVQSFFSTLNLINNNNNEGLNKEKENIKSNKNINHNYSKYCSHISKLNFGSLSSLHKDGKKKKAFYQLGNSISNVDI